MTTTAGSSEQIEAYLAAVRASLGDIAEDERAELLAEVEASLIESAGEIDRPTAALGPPEAFAAELRASAGLGEPAPFDAPSSGALDAVRTFARELGRRPWAARTRVVARELAPAGWLVRGYLVVVVIAALTNATWSPTRPWLPDFATHRDDILIIVLAVAGSLALGVLRRRRVGSLLLLALLVDIAAVLAIVPAERHVTNAPATVFIEGAPAAPVVVLPGLSDSGRPLLNIYPYSRAGKLLHDVRLYDDLGRPITLALGSDQLRRVPVTATGLPALNAFPIRYRQPGTKVVAHPDAGPRIRVPKLVTPALRP
jgi:hypothetical protein